MANFESFIFLLLFLLRDYSTSYWKSTSLCKLSKISIDFIQVFSWISICSLINLVLKGILSTINLDGMVGTIPQIK